MGKNVSPLNRRDFMQRSAKSAVAAGMVFPAIHSQAATQPPNVVFIICDQMRGDSMSCLNHPIARTPHLDGLAEDGVLFKRCYSNNPVCVPSRMSIFSGLYPHQTGRLSNRDWDTPLLKIENTLAHAFQSMGYRTGWVGKNHTYQNSEFETFETSSIRAREPFRKYSRFVPPHWHSDTLWPEEICHPRRNTDEAVEFINKSKANQPFFLHVSYFDPHPPYMAPSEYTSRYCSTDIQVPETVRPGALSRRLEQFATAMHLDELSDSDLTETMRYYYASIEWGVDAQVGRIMKALKDKGLEENTIVVFTSDHGDFIGDYRMVRKGMFHYDALLHVPMIWYAPGRISKGITSENLVQGIDIFPTLIDLCSGQTRDDLQGRSLKPMLRGENPDNEDHAIFTSGAYGHVEPVNNPSTNLSDEDDTPLHTRVMHQSMEPSYKTSMIRTRDWKFILNEADSPELYNMAEGKERENLAEKKEHLAVRKSLESQLKQWWQW